jgi:hypothetical protein
MVLQENEKTRFLRSDERWLGRSISLSYPVVLMILGLLVIGSCYRTLRSQQSPIGFCSDQGEGLTSDKREAIINAKRWIEVEMMGNAVSLDARYQVKEVDGMFVVHVVFVTGYSPWGAPLFIPNGHCYLRVRNQGEVEFLNHSSETASKAIGIHRAQQERLLTKVQIAKISEINQIQGAVSFSDAIAPLKTMLADKQRKKWNEIATPLPLRKKNCG